jgi:hypothetical protein
MENKILKDLTFKKTNLSLNLYTKPIFDNDNEVFYSSGNKIISFDLMK